MEQVAIAIPPVEGTYKPYTDSDERHACTAVGVTFSGFGRIPELVLLVRRPDGTVYAEIASEMQRQPAG